MIRPLDFQVPYLFRNRKSRSFQGCQDQLDLRPFEGGHRQPNKGRRLVNHAGALKGPRRLHTKKRKSPWVLLSSCTFFTPFSNLLNTKNTQKTHQSLLILLFTKNKRYCSYTKSSSPWFYTLDLGFRGVDVAF